MGQRLSPRMNVGDGEHGEGVGEVGQDGEGGKRSRTRFVWSVELCRSHNVVKAVTIGIWVCLELYRFHNTVKAVTIRWFC